MKLSLIVLRVSNIELSRQFYSIAFGVVFAQEKHGNGPEHYAADIGGGLVLELYPHSAAYPLTNAVRLGVCVPGLVDKLLALESLPCVQVIHPNSSEWGKRAVVVDPDGHKIDLAQE